MKLVSFCSTIKNRSNIIYKVSNFNEYEKFLFNKIENTLIFMKKENENNPNYFLLSEAFKKPFPLFFNFLKSIIFNIKSIEKLKNEYNYEFIITDWNSTDGDINAICKDVLKDTNYTYKVVKINEPGFSRGKGLNRAFQESKGDIIFFIDTDMLIYDSRLLLESFEMIEKGYIVWPVCYKSSDPSNFQLTIEWAGYGNCIFSKEDFIHFGPWSEYKKWGKEDTDLYLKVYKNNKNKIFRKPYQGFIHQWHSDQLRNIYGEK